MHLRSNGYINENKAFYIISSQMKAVILATDYISQTKTKNPDSFFFFLGKTQQTALKQVKG